MQPRLQIELEVLVVRIKSYERASKNPKKRYHVMTGANLIRGYFQSPLDGGVSLA